MQPADDTCEWTQADPWGFEEGYWSTACGESFSFNDGTPSENRQRFCGYCGKRLIEVAWVNPPDEDDEDGDAATVSEGSK